MTSDRLKGLVFPVATLLALEALARITHLRSDSLAAPSEIAMAFAQAVGDGSLAVTCAHRLLSIQP